MFFPSSSLNEIDFIDLMRTRFSVSEKFRERFVTHDSMQSVFFPLILVLYVFLFSRLFFCVAAHGVSVSLLRITITHNTYRELLYANCGYMT